jgi:hypothetical protein
VGELATVVPPVVVLVPVAVDVLALAVVLVVEDFLADAWLVALDFSPPDVDDAGFVAFADFTVVVVFGVVVVLTFVLGGFADACAFTLAPCGAFDPPVGAFGTLACAFGFCAPPPRP